MKISLITPTFNRAAKLEEAIQSTLAQTYTNWEMIVVDDGSSDQTEVVVEKYTNSDPRIRYIRNPGKGPASARNFGVLHSHGEYLAFLDDDDISLPHRFESQLDAINRSGRDFLVSGYEVRNRTNNTLIGRYAKNMKGFGAGFPSRWMIKKELYEKTGGYDVDIFGMEDPEFSYRVAKFEIYAFHQEVVTVMFRSPDSISSQYRALLAKVEMMKKSFHLMHPVEAAWWYYIIAYDFYRLNDIRKAAYFFEKVKNLNARKLYKLSYYFFHLVKFIKQRHIKRVNQKVLLQMANLRFPRLVEHPEV